MVKSSPYITITKKCLGTNTYCKEVNRLKVGSVCLVADTLDDTLQDKKGRKAPTVGQCPNLHLVPV